MSEKYYNTDTPDESPESTDTPVQPSKMTDVGKQSMRGALEYSNDTQDAIASINEQPVEEHSKLVAELQENNPKAWDELRKLGGISGKGILDPNGELLIPYSEDRSEKSE